MRFWTVVIAVALVGCVGGPGEGFGDGGAGSRSSSGSSGSSGPSASGGSSGATSAIIRASSFDKSCNVASDCIAIYEGNVCSPCACPNAAIASSQQGAYAAQASQLRATCGAVGDVACGPCSSTTTVCAGNRCAVAIGIADAGGD